MSKLNVYAWNRPGVANFGDELGPDILRRIGHDVTRTSVERADVIVCGSVLEQAVTAPRGCVIAGAGSMWMGLKKLPNAAHLDIRALRGTLTWDVMGAGTKNSPGDVALGDPGILVPELYDLGIRQANKVGVVPHYIDSRVHEYGDVIIDVQAPVEEVVYEISKCSYILSSSLHGLIVAQSLGIPATRLPYHKVIGGDLKWIDYASGVAGGLKQAQENLYNVLENL